MDVFIQLHEQDATANQSLNGVPLVWSQCFPLLPLTKKLDWDSMDSWLLLYGLFSLLGFIAYQPFYFTFISKTFREDRIIRRYRM